MDSGRLQWVAAGSCWGDMPSVSVNSRGRTGCQSPVWLGIGGVQHIFFLLSPQWSLRCNGTAVRSLEISIFSPQWSLRCNGTAVRSLEIRKPDGPLSLCEIELLGQRAYECKCENGEAIPGYYCHEPDEMVGSSCV